MIEIIDYLALALIPIFMILDLIYRVRKYDTPKWWRLNGALITSINLYLSVQFATFWGNVYTDINLLELSNIGIVPGAIAGILAYELGHWIYHFSAHKISWLWRIGHQMHHAPESLDAFGAFYQHPLDLFFFVSVSSAILFPVLGISVESAVLVNFFLIFNALFQHANISTPRWLGYIIQRPESHEIHHQRGVHAYNYSDLPFIDMIFGTFQNGDGTKKSVGFYTGASDKLAAMVFARDVSRVDINKDISGSASNVVSG